jgi:hypothetical protein
LTARNGFPNNTKVNASRIVDFPAPLSPMIRVDLVLSNWTSVNALPVLRKFFQRIFLK